MGLSKRANHGAEEFPTEQEAIEAARKLAKSPRVAAVLRGGEIFAAVPGYIDGDTDKTKQVALVTPDGKVWRPETSPLKNTPQELDWKNTSELQQAAFNRGALPALEIEQPEPGRNS